MTTQNTGKARTADSSPVGNRKSRHPSAITPLLSVSEIAELRQALPGWKSLRLTSGDTGVHLSNKRLVARLPAAMWPRRFNKPLWPSTPSITEWIEMLRRGVKQPRDRVVVEPRARRSLKQFNSDIELASETITRNVIGIRSDERVPEEFLEYFRYRWGFLLLHTRAIPAGLARFLASRWLTRPSSLWLEERLTLKSYLRKLPLSVIYRSEERKVRHNMSPSLMSDSEYDSEPDYSRAPRSGPDEDQEFLELLNSRWR